MCVSVSVCLCTEGRDKKGGVEIRRIMILVMGRTALVRGIRGQIHPWRNITELLETTSGIHFTHENKKPVYPHLSSAAQSKDVKCPVWGGGREFCVFWEPFTSAAFGCPEVMLSACPCSSSFTG